LMEGVLNLSTSSVFCSSSRDSCWGSCGGIKALMCRLGSLSGVLKRGKTYSIRNFFLAKWVMSFSVLIRRKYIVYWSNFIKKLLNYQKNPFDFSSNFLK
jgi:hypothetical protein